MTNLSLSILDIKVKVKFKDEFLNTGSSDDLKTGQEIEVFEKLEDREVM